MKKILIVDDEQDIVESLKFVLEVSGYVCYTAYNGEDGLRLAKEIMPDLIILDVMMPKINGYKISRLLKYDSKYKDIPIIMVTARSQLDFVQLPALLQLLFSGILSPFPMRTQLLYFTKYICDCDYFSYPVFIYVFIVHISYDISIW